MNRVMIGLLIILSSFFFPACSGDMIHRRAVADLNVKAKALLDQGNLDGAISRLESARDLDPQEPNTLYNLGIAYSQKGKLDQAIHEFETLLRTGKMDQARILQPLEVAYEQKADEMVNTAIDAKEKKDMTTSENARKNSLGYYQKAIETLEKLKTTSAGSPKSSADESSATLSAADLDQRKVQLAQRIKEVEQGKMTVTLGSKSSNTVKEVSPE